MSGRGKPNVALIRALQASLADPYPSSFPLSLPTTAHSKTYLTRSVWKVVTGSTRTPRGGKSTMCRCRSKCSLAPRPTRPGSPNGSSHTILSAGSKGSTALAGLCGCGGCRSTSFAAGGSQESPSTVGREIMYSIAHAAHHYAVIGVMGGIMGLKMLPGFGVAPSTLKHQAETARAAA